MDFLNINNRKHFSVSERIDNKSCSFQHNNTDDTDSEPDTVKIPTELLGVLKSNIKNSDLQNDIIQKKLDEIEKKHNIKIIYACEVGSKAWGSDSRNSDFDIRYIYVSNKSHYINEPQKDFIKNELNDEFDIYGFDLSKILESLQKQHYNAYEWINSPIKYRTSPISENLEELINQKSNPKNLFKNYLNLSDNNYMNLIKKQEKVEIKSYLFVLKTLLMAEYINNTGKLPPLNIQEIFDLELKENKDISNIANELLLQKKTSSKQESVAHIPVLDSFIEDKLTLLAKEHVQSEPVDNVNEIDAFFKKTINLKDFDEINQIKLSELEKKRLNLFSEDIEYKQQLLEALGISPKEHLSVRSIVGQKEFEYILKKYNEMPEVYSTNLVTDESGNIKLQNVINCKYRANLHTHTINSDGKMSVKELLDAAAKYSDRIEKKIEKEHIEDFEPFTIAITDHNTTKGCQEAVQIIQSNPEKYKNLRLVLGIELSAAEKEADGYASSKAYQVHLLAQNINPFDEELNNKIAQRLNEKNPNYASLGNIDTVVSLLDSQPEVTLGYAHPLAGLSYKKVPVKEVLPNIIKDLIKKFKNASDEHVCYVENYYQSYTNSIGQDEDLKQEIREYSKDIGLLNSGGLDTHGKSIFFG